MTKVLVVVTDGSEDMETVVCLDILRRAQLDVTLASLFTSLNVRCAQGTLLVADAVFGGITAEDFGCVVLPGGMGGALAFAAHAPLHELLRSFEQKGKVIAALCAAPIALHPARVAKAKRVTSHPSVKATLMQTDWFKEYSEDRVVVDDNFITSRGPGTSVEFALAIVKNLCGKDLANQVAAPMMLHPGLVIV
ncbi:hypothetical protein HDU98_008846 [Podochytrium sp. JEL0797]|nr:hypothetical protein HDU98_008837 [Podochytrium sp. JEL0797]KAJ3075239.1 hypothetical protein HDU98_008846 [Podochytrium sp. JEL0797]